MAVINHLHIPRCSGIYIKSHITNDLKARGLPYFATNHGEIYSDTFDKKVFISGHFGLTPLKYVSNLINICLVREPVERFISNFIYLHQDLIGSEIDDHIEAWIENPKQHNLQTRFLNKQLNEGLYNSLNHGSDRALNGWCLEEGSVDIGEVKSFVDSIDLLDVFENHGDFVSKLNELVNKEYGFYTFSNRNFINNNFRILPISKSLRNRILDLNALDVELYEYVKHKR